MSDEINDILDIPEDFEVAPAKKSKKTLWIILAIVAVVLLCCCCLMVTLIIIGASTGWYEDTFNYFTPLLQFV